MTLNSPTSLSSHLCKRNLHRCKRALHLFKRALHRCIRNPHLSKKNLYISGLCARKSAVSMLPTARQKSPRFLQKSPTSLPNSPIYVFFDLYEKALHRCKRALYICFSTSLQKSPMDTLPFCWSTRRIDVLPPTRQTRCTSLQKRPTSLQKSPVYVFLHFCK